MEQEDHQHIKRERETSLGIVAGDGDDEVQVVSTRPTKKVRRSPGEGDEVVVLDERVWVLGEYQEYKTSRRRRSAGGLVRLTHTAAEKRPGSSDRSA